LIISIFSETHLDKDRIAPYLRYFISVLAGTNLNFVIDYVAVAPAAFNLGKHNDENKCRRFLEETRREK